MRRQREAGVDIVSDGEMMKISYSTYILRRVTGLELAWSAYAPGYRTPALTGTGLCFASFHQGVAA